MNIQFVFGGYLTSRTKGRGNTFQSFLVFEDLKRSKRTPVDEIVQYGFGSTSGIAQARTRVR